VLHAVAAGQDNLVVMLNRDVDALEDPRLLGWTIWWGANLGTTSEELVSGPVAGVLAQIRSARDRARVAAGWVMDVYLLRAPDPHRATGTAGDTAAGMVGGTAGTGGGGEAAR
jgi:precorrin-6A synthase